MEAFLSTVDFTDFVHEKYVNDVKDTCYRFQDLQKVCCPEGITVNGPDFDYIIKSNRSIKSNLIDVRVVPKGGHECSFFFGVLISRKGDNIVDVLPYMNGHRD